MTPTEPSYLPCSDFLVLGSGPGHECVEAWSLRRLPFEPTGSDLEFRGSLRPAISELKSRQGSVLHAIYASEVVATCDAENVLIYNVGVGTFRRLTQSGLRFERANVAPPPTSSGTYFPHYHRYQLTDRADLFQHWNKDAVFARFDAGAISLMTELRNPSMIWYRMKRGSASLVHHAPTGGEPFGLSVVIQKPLGSTLSAASIVKTVFDGLITAFHAHQGEQIDQVSTRLSSSLGTTAEDVRKMLTDDRLNVLGTRRLLWPFREGIQWNPADDRCVAGELLVDDEPTNSGWRIYGELFTVTCRSQWLS